MNEKTTPEVSPKDVVFGSFAGAFSRFQSACYVDLKVCGFSEKVAHAIAVDLGSDIGRLLATDPEIAAKVSAANKNDNSRLAISAKATLAMSGSMRVQRLCLEWHKLHKEGLLAVRQIPMDLLGDKLAKYVASKE